MDHFSSVAQSCPALCNPMNCSTPGLPVHHQLLEFTQLMSTESVMPSNHLIICCPLLLPPSIFPSIRVFSNESALRIRWPKYWSFSFNISPFNEHPGLISFRSIPFLSFLEPIFTWKFLLISLIFLKRSLIFPILLFSSISSHWSLRKAFLSLLAIL